MGPASARQLVAWGERARQALESALSSRAGMGFDPEELAAERSLERWLPAWRRRPERPGAALSKEGDRAGGPQTPRRVRRADAGPLPP